MLFLLLLFARLAFNSEAWLGYQKQHLNLQPSDPHCCIDDASVVFAALSPAQAHSRST